MNSVIIYIHRGFSHYLDPIFAITKHYNKDTRIILIGDNDNDAVAKKYSIEHYLISDYNEEIPYHHVSVNTFSYEKFCFNRWFVLNKFINKQQIDHFVYSDSDNMILYDINSIKYDNAYIGNSSVVVPNIFFCNSDLLNKICNYYTELFNVEYDIYFKRVVNTAFMHYHENNKNKPHFSDMMFLRMAIYELDLPFERLNEKPVGEYCFNSNINNIQTEIRDNKVYIKDTNTFLMNLHFAGSAKSIINNYLILLDKLI